jgi:hypothetical protein
MLRRLLVLALLAGSASAAHAQLFPRLHRPTTPTSEPSPGVVNPPPQQQPLQPAVGLAAVNSPFWFGTDFGVGGPGYQFRGYPPYNGWSGGYRGAYYGEPVPGAAAYRGRWAR